MWLPKIPVPKVVNEKEENVWTLISASTPSPGEKKGEEDKHVSVLHSVSPPDNYLKEPYCIIPDKGIIISLNFRLCGLLRLDEYEGQHLLALVSTC